MADSRRLLKNQGKQVASVFRGSWPLLAWNIQSDYLLGGIIAHSTWEGEGFASWFYKLYTTKEGRLITSGISSEPLYVGYLLARSKRRSLKQARAQVVSKNSFKSNSWSSSSPSSELSSSELFGLEHLYCGIKAHDFPAPYGEGELDEVQMHVLNWLGTTLGFNRPMGCYQLLILGYENDCIYLPFCP